MPHFRGSFQIRLWKREFSRSHFVTVSIAAVLIMLMTVIRQRPQELHQIALF
jgi:hypothetical protein